jgi:hypothetical protein
MNSDKASRFMGRASSLDRDATNGCVVFHHRLSPFITGRHFLCLFARSGISKSIGDGGAHKVHFETARLGGAVFLRDFWEMPK